MIASSVFVLDHTPLGGGRLGGGAAHNAVRRGVNHVDDGVIADTARTEGMMLVTAEHRLRNRAAEIDGLVVLRLADLLAKLRNVQLGSACKQ